MADLGFGARLEKPTERLWQVRVLLSGISREMDESESGLARERKLVISLLIYKTKECYHR